MARVGIVFGLLLCGVTFLGLVGTLVKSPTQFYPMMLGIPVLFCGVVALNPHRRKHAMHVATGVALLGAVVGGGCAVYGVFELAGGEEVNQYALGLVAAMSAICAVFVAICVASFIRARRRMVPAPASSSGPRSGHKAVSDAPVPAVSSRESA
jgi:phosphate/sulfate permease